MTTNTQRSPFLQKQRNFPKELEDFTTEVDKAYIDIANKVNERIIGIFAVNFPIITGETWFLRGQNSQQTLRQVYPFTTATAIPHGINFTQIAGFTKLYGTYTDGTNWYGVIAATNTPIPDQLTFYVDPTNIVLTLDGAAPAIVSGFIVLEWLTQA